MRKSRNGSSATISKAETSGESEMTFTNSFKMVLSEKVEDSAGKKVHKEVGSAQVFTPVLSDFGITAEFAVGEDGKQLFDEDTGLPVYSDPRLDWLFAAILGKVQQQARNKFTNGKLKDGAKLATNFDELTAIGERTGEALKIRHEARKSFMAYLSGLGKKAATIAQLSELFHNPDTLSLAGPQYVAAISKHVEAWLDGLSEDDASRYSSKISKLSEALEAAKTAHADDDLN